MAHGSRHVAVIVGVTLAVSACGATGPTTSTPPAPAISSPVPTAVEIPMGQLEAGATYVLPTETALTVTPDADWGAAPAPGGISLISGQTTVRIITGVTDAYVEAGATEPIGDDADAIVEQLRRNERLSVESEGEAAVGAASAAYVDASAIVDPIESEGGTLVFQAVGEPVRLADDFVNRVFIIDAGATPTVVIVSAPEREGLDAALERAAAILASLRPSE